MVINIAIQRTKDHKFKSAWGFGSIFFKINLYIQIANHFTYLNYTLHVYHIIYHDHVILKRATLKQRHQSLFQIMVILTIGSSNTTTYAFTCQALCISITDQYLKYVMYTIQRVFMSFCFWGLNTLNYNWYKIRQTCP